MISAIRKLDWKPISKKAKSGETVLLMNINETDDNDQPFVISDYWEEDRCVKNWNFWFEMFDVGPTHWALYTQPPKPLNRLTDEELEDAERQGYKNYEERVVKKVFRGQIITPMAQPDWHIYQAIQDALIKKNGG